MLAATFRGHKGYLFQRTYDITGVDIPKLKAAFELVFRESDILRTTLSMEGGRFLQTVRTDFRRRFEPISSCRGMRSPLP